MAAQLPDDLSRALDQAWRAASEVPGFLTESEARFLGTVLACISGEGVAVEIGSFKGKSSVMLGMIAAHYGLGPITAIDPHGFNSAELAVHKPDAGASTFDEFKANIDRAGVSQFVQPLRAFSSDIWPHWNSLIRFLWIDGDHSYRGAKSDFDGFVKHMVPGGIVAFHDALHEFPGPIRVFVEDVLRSDEFGAAGFVGSIAWAQFRPGDGFRYRKQRTSLARRAAALLPFVEGDSELRGLRKVRFKLNRARVPRSFMGPARWVRLLEGREHV